MTVGNSDKNIYFKLLKMISLSVFFLLPEPQTNCPGIARCDDCFGDDLDATTCSALRKKNSSETNVKEKLDSLQVVCIVGKCFLHIIECILCTHLFDSTSSPCT